MEAQTSTMASQAVPASTTMSPNTSLSAWDLLPFRTLYLDVVSFTATASLPVILFGIIANTLNMVVFLKTRARDNVTISLLALASSDLAFLVLISPSAVAFFMWNFLINRLGLEVRWLLDRQIVMFLFYWYGFIFYETSALITTYVSVVRCACVAMPLRFKTTFTARRTITSIMCFFLIIVLLRLPMLMTKTVGQQLDPVTNTSRLVYLELDDGGLADFINDLVNRNILPYSSFIIVLSSVIVMATKLKASLRFRALASSDSEGNKQRHRYDENHEETTTEAYEKTFKASTLSRDEQKTQYGKNRQTMSRKEAQVVLSVVIVSVIFISGQTPFVAYSLARRFEPEFNDQYDDENGPDKYIYLFAVATNISTLFAYINASVNIFVFYNFNARYRQHFQELFAKN